MVTIVLLGHHLGELGDIRDAEPSVSQGLRDLRKGLEEPGRDLAVEEARESELPVYAKPVELGEREEEIDEGAVLAAREFCDAEGPIARVHGSTLARGNLPSSDARGRAPESFSERGSRTPPEAPRASPARSAAATGAFLARGVAGT
jgi:hypothetical protein